MITPRSRYGITRVDQVSKSNYGFYVRITHHRITYSQWFPDKSSGGKKKALKLAKEYRNSILAKMPKHKQRQAARKKRKILKSGVIGVTHVINKSPKGKKYEYWQASWVDEYGNRRTKKFSFSRYGKEKALELAIKVRNRTVREVKKVN
jgi:hypothetical protein